MTKKHSTPEELNHLLNEWDPIGVLPLKGGPKDEYQCLIGPLLSLLNKKVDKKEIVTFLNKQLTDHMGLDPQYSKPEEFIDKLLDWWDKQKSQK
jgi:hypothetical protein